MSVNQPDREQQNFEQWSYVSQQLRSAYGPHAYRAILIDYDCVEEWDESEFSDLEYYVTVYDEAGQALKPDLRSSFWSQEAFIDYYSWHLTQYERYHATLTDEQKWILIAEDFCQHLFPVSKFAEGEYLFDTPSIAPLL